MNPSGRASVMRSILTNTSRGYMSAYRRTHDREFLGRSELLRMEAERRGEEGTGKQEEGGRYRGQEVTWTGSRWVN